MRKLRTLLRERRGETLVEVLVSTVVFLLLLAALSGAVAFAHNAEVRSGEIRDHANGFRPTTPTLSAKTARRPPVHSRRCTTPRGSTWALP